MKFAINRERAAKSSFWSGFITYGAMMSLWQDHTGKARYIARLDSGWVDASITVPVAIAALAFALYLRHRAEQKQ